MQQSGRTISKTEKKMRAGNGGYINNCDYGNGNFSSSIKNNIT